MLKKTKNANRGYKILYAIVITGIIILGLCGGSLIFKKTATEISFEMNTEGAASLIRAMKENKSE